MADIQKLTYPYFTDGTTPLNAINLNQIVAKINEVIDKVNGGVTPTQTVATPTINISGSTATISCSTSGATIYYTLNGNTPTTSSTQYSSPITLSGACTIKAIAVKSGMNDSQVANQSYSPSSIDLTSAFNALTWEEGAINNTTGAETTSSSYYRCPAYDISAYAGKFFNYSRITRQSDTVVTFGLAFYDDNMLYISSGNESVHYGALSDGYEDSKVLIPEGAKYVRMTRGASEGFYVHIVDATKVALTGFSTWVDGKGLKYSDGSEITKSLYQYCSDYIDISSYVGKLLNYSRIRRASNVDSVGMVFYDSSQGYVSGQRIVVSSAAGDGKQDQSILIPVGVKYVRFTWYSANGDGYDWANDFYAKVVTNF